MRGHNATDLDILARRYSYIQRTMHTHSAKQQADELGISVKAIYKYRAKIAPTKRISITGAAAPARVCRAWTEADTYTLDYMLEDGLALGDIATQLGRTIPAIETYIRRTKQSSVGKERARFGTMSKDQVARIMGVDEWQVRRWIQRGVLVAYRRYQVYPTVQTPFAITPSALTDFLYHRQTWMSWSVACITDRNWQDTARGALLSAAGVWLDTGAIGVKLGYSTARVQYWLRKGLWDVEHTRWNHHWYVWVAEGATLTPPADQRKQNGRKARAQ